jgi:pyruvate ferredoxin oxidoreductase gamma subunit
MGTLVAEIIQGSVADAGCFKKTARTHVKSRLLLARSGWMHAVRIHGRGGQGVVTAAELLSMAAFTDRKHALAFPSFGSERMGAPVMAFCRIDEQPIRTREAVTHPDVVIVQDPTLLHHVDVFGGLSVEGYVLVNSTFSVEELGLEEFLATLPNIHCCIVPASDIGQRHLKRPIANTSLLGAFAAMTGFIKLASVDAAIRHKFPGAMGQANAAAAREAYDQLTAFLSEQGRVSEHARAN